MTAGEDFLSFLQNLDVPQFDIGTRVGHTDYIDFIKPEEIHHPVMKGIDINSRPFLILKAVANLDNGDKVELFQTFFQRYSDDQSTWMGCGNHGRQIFDTCGGMRKAHFCALKRLVTGEPISLDGFVRGDELKIKQIELI